MNVKVSIVIPVYNVEEYLADCLESVLKQDFHDYEVIAVNDGSIDNSLNILNSYKAKFSGRLSIISTDNNGLSAARNVGIINASGDYIYLLDSDDWITSDLLSSCLAMFVNNSVDMVMFNAEAFNDDFDYVVAKDAYLRRVPEGKYTGRALFNMFIESDKYIVSACCYMFKLDAYKNFAFKEGILHEDNLFTTNLLLKEKSRVFVLDKVLFKRRYRKNSIMTQGRTQKHADGYFSTCEILATEFPKYKTDTTLYKSLLKYYRKLFLIATGIDYHVNNGSKLKKKVRWLFTINKFGIDYSGSIYIISKKLFYLPTNFKARFNMKTS